MRSCRISSDECEGGAKVGDGVVDQVFADGETVFVGGGVGVFGGEAVADGDDDERGGGGVGFEEGVLGGS